MSQPVSFLMVDDEQFEALDYRGAFTTMTRLGTRDWPADQVALLISHLNDTEPAVIEIGLVRRSRMKPATGGIGCSTRGGTSSSLCFWMISRTHCHHGSWAPSESGRRTAAF